MTTTNQALTLNAEPRETTGKAVRSLRRQGLTPANLYGRGTQSVSLQIPTKALEQALAAGGRASLLTLTVNGTSHRALLRDLQRHPVSRLILHAEFYKVDMARSIQTVVPIHTVGEAPAARLPDSVITQMLHAVEIECLPANIPAGIDLDLSALTDLDTALVVRDLRVPSGVTVLTDGDQPVVRAAHARKEEARPAAEAAAEEAAAPVEGAAETQG